MEYRQIVAVTKLSGLYQLMSTKNDGAIVKSLTDNTVKFISARIHNLTPLESIEIYTYEENVKLHEVFEKMKENDTQVDELNGKKDDKAIKAYFKTILPIYDEDRVYVSDIKKILKWYAILKAKDLLQFDYLKEEEAAVEQEAAEAVVTEMQPETEKVKKAAKKQVKEKEEVADKE